MKWKLQVGGGCWWGVGGVSEGGEREGKGGNGCGRGVNGCGRLMGKGMGTGVGVEVGLMRLRSTVN